jgi:hypothetical protein
MYIVFTFRCFRAHPETGTKTIPGAFAHQVLGPYFLTRHTWHDGEKSGRLVMNL